MTALKVLALVAALLALMSFFAGVGVVTAHIIAGL
jgi:hypothetical protein